MNKITWADFNRFMNDNKAYGDYDEFMYPEKKEVIKNFPPEMWVTARFP